MADVVNKYIATVLIPQLNQLGVSLDFQHKICETVTIQMNSALYNWQYSDMKRLLMLLVTEESHFYEPDAPEDVKAFVVLTIRNSPIESLQSDSYSVAGLKGKITEDELRGITSSAIQFFKDIDLDSLYEEITIDESDDLYGQLCDKYIIATRALNQLAESEEPTCSFSSYAIKDANKILAPLLSNKATLTVNGRTVFDGYDKSIDLALYKQLQSIAGDKQFFFVDCFKMLSRNPEKVMAVIEYLLSQDATFVTSNYLLQHTHAEKRIPILRAASSKSVSDDIHAHLKQTQGLSPHHKKALAALATVVF